MDQQITTSIAVVVGLILLAFYFNRMPNKNVGSREFKVTSEMRQKINNRFVPPPGMVDKYRHFNNRDLVMDFSCLSPRLDESFNRCPTKSPVFRENNSIFNIGTGLRNFQAFGSPSEQKCLAKAKQVCRVRSIPSSTCYNHQYRHNALQMFPRSGELVGSYLQETNNQYPYTKCDCANRSFDMCPTDEKVSEQCLYNAMKNCLTGHT